MNRRILLAATAIASAFTGAASAQTAQGAAGEEVEAVIVTGTRRVDRTAFDAPAPVDVVSQQALETVVSDQVTDKLVAITPSFNVLRNPTADGQQYVRPATLRGLAAHHTLVLVNGKRRHRSAFLSGSVQAPDLATIPSSALKRIEVLRDGASAQYGSDAIAGVINLILSDEPGFSGTAQASQYFEGDGRLVEVSLRQGFALGDGHLNLNFAYADADPTSRTRQRADAIAFQNANPTLVVPNPVQRWGQPERETLRWAYDLATPLTEGVELYSFATYASSRGVNDFNWRNPATDTSYRTSAVFPGFNLRSVYPVGFSPKFGQEEDDYQINGGLRGEVGAGLAWDLSAAQGQDRIEYFLDNTINASLGPGSPRNFRPGVLIQRETNLNLDFSWPLNIGLSEPANLAFGGERRIETYEIEAGDPASYAVGPGAATGLPSGSNGFPGYGPSQAGSWDQKSWAGYADLDLKLTPQLSAAAALRHEDFTTFGSTTNYKVSGRYKIVPGAALRATWSTGFRAPTPAQVFSSRTSQGLDTTTLQLFTSGRLSPLDPVARFFGATPLKPEKSENLALGAVFRAGGFTGSVDYYRIKVEDRLSSSANFSVTPAVRAQLIAMGVPGADSLTSLSYFTNAFDTRTQGVDVVASYRTLVGPGSFSLTAAYNWNDTKVTRAASTISLLNRINLEDSLPEQTGNLTADYTVGRWAFMLRGRYFGAWTDAQFQDSSNLVQEFGARVFVDASVSADIGKGMRLTVGAENLFDTYPDEATFQASRGLIYSRNAVYDTDGGRYYVRLALRR
jgi:iron complex outermembrane receptor protein